MSALARLGLTAAALYEDINRATTTDHLDNFAKTVTRHWATGAIPDDEANVLFSAIEHRRPLGRRTPGTGHSKPVGRLAMRLGSRFVPRQRPRSPDRRASRNRRRMLGGSSALPDNLRHHYTEGQRSVLCIVAGEVKRHGVCDLPIDKIGALAGVCRTTVQTTMHEARRLGHIKITERPMPGRKSLPNLVTITSVEWRTWLRRGPSAAHRIGSNPVILASTTKSTSRKKEGAGDEKRQLRGRGPPHAPMRLMA